VTKPFEVGQEMTATYKLKRHVITRQYASLIEEMFSAQQEVPARQA
jgi:long-chain acyl-CoA synthetase